MIEAQPNTDQNQLFETMSTMDHEQLVFCRDEATGLKAIIGIHNTVLGPAMGGTRMWNYDSEEAAIRDVLRLSRGMTLKNAIAGLNIGGGKTVIIGDAKKMKSEALLRRFGKFVNSLNGKYWTAPDVNMGERDMEYIRMETPYVAGTPENMGGSGDPSPMTAYGVYHGIKASAKEVYGNDSLEGKKIVIQGAGQVGKYLVDHLVKENAKVCISDIFEDKIKAITKKHKVEVLDPDKVFEVEMDIFSPCALGASLNSKSIPQLKCAIVAGAANNQLEEENLHAEMLAEREILYAPDFLINSGGITNVYYELKGNFNKERVKDQTSRIYEVTLDVFKHAKENKTTTHKAALQIALNRIESVGKTKLGY
ncbi:MAG: Glu/Leu/Phe/Val dehydrogenase [Bacteroidota bacterium]